MSPVGRLVGVGSERDKSRWTLLMHTACHYLSIPRIGLASESAIFACVASVHGCATPRLAVVVGFLRLCSC